MFTVNIGFIGAGNMAQAIAFSLKNSGVIDSHRITASAPSMSNLKTFKDAGMKITSDNNDVISFSDIIFLAIKPQYLDNAIQSLKKIPSEGKVYVSILAGVKLKTIEQKFQNQSKTTIPYKIIRVMPNTPILVGAGCSLMTPNENTTEEEISIVQSIMNVGGICELIAENLINSCSAVCGSGPAFIFMAIEALADGAVLRGVPRALALKLAAKAVEGAGKLASVTGKHPGQLKDEVCSPGGSTIVGVHKLEDSGLRSAFINAAIETAKRNDQLSSLH